MIANALKVALGALVVGVGASPNVSEAPKPLVLPQDSTEAALFEAAARTAWEFVDRNTLPSGLTRATNGWEEVTTWDIASMLAAVVSAEGMGLITADDARRRAGAIVDVLGRVDLYDGAAFNKQYNARALTMTGRDGKPTRRGVGWSVLDTGRLLIWLDITARAYPELRRDVEAVVARLDFDRLVVDGYLTGEDLDSQGRPRTYPEGRLGYEQYAAEGFRLWGYQAEASADVHRHAEPMDVMGVPMLRDARGRNRITSEPFVLMGMETGWTPDMRELAWKALAAQEARYRDTGNITMVSEDAVDIAPHYFYYYNIVSGDAEVFGVDAQGPMDGPGPRWISTKAAYAWHALLPSPYTREAVSAVESARTTTGWASGVFEKDGSSTGVRNINTAAIVLEAAYYATRGTPIRYRVASGTEGRATP